MRKKKGLKVTRAWKSYKILAFECHDVFNYSYNQIITPVSVACTVMPGNEDVLGYKQLTAPSWNLGTPSKIFVESKDPVWLTGIIYIRWGDQKKFVCKQFSFSIEKIFCNKKCNKIFKTTKTAHCAE